jgi:hypothetical protein
MEAGGQFHRDLDGFSSLIGPNFNFAMSASVGFENKVARDDDANGKPGRMVSVGAMLSWRCTIC